MIENHAQTQFKGEADRADYQKSPVSTINYKLTDKSCNGNGFMWIILLSHVQYVITSDYVQLSQCGFFAG